VKVLISVFVFEGGRGRGGGSPALKHDSQPKVVRLPLGREVGGGREGLVRIYRQHSIDMRISCFDVVSRLCPWGALYKAGELEFPAASGGKTSLGGTGKDGSLFRTKATFERTACPLYTAHEKEKGRRLNRKGCERGKEKH
jgi:hypothetical protein